MQRCYINAVIQEQGKPKTCNRVGHSLIKKLLLLFNVKALKIMKKMKLFMVLVFVMAIGFAFASKENAATLFADSEQWVGTDCVPVTSGCLELAPINCGVVVYKLHGPGELPCSVQLTKRNP